jgi:hypothetical protein
VKEGKWDAELCAGSHQMTVRNRSRLSF